MAKGTSFAAKAKGKKKKSQTLVKYIKSVKSEKTGHWRFNEQMIALEDSENLDGALQRLKDETLALDMELPNPEGDVKESADVRKETVVDAVQENDEEPEVEASEELSNDGDEAATADEVTVEAKEKAAVEDNSSDETEEKAAETIDADDQDTDQKEEADKEEKAKRSEEHI